MRNVAFFSVLWVAECASLMAQERAQVPEVPNPPPAPAQPLPGEFAPSDLEGIDRMPARVRAVIERASELSKKRLGYRYGSADPAAGAMDCSGTIFCLLREAGVADVPRQSDAIYRWVWQGSRVYPVIGRSENTFELEKLRPGDLLFWTGTYSVEREVPITHVMLYLGTRVADGRRVMFGASDGRTYQGASCFGVGVFDFLEPRSGSGTARFVGYGPIPGLNADPR